MNIVVEHDGVMRTGIPVLMSKNGLSVVAVVLKGDVLSIATPLFLDGRYTAKNGFLEWVGDEEVEKLEHGHDVILEDYIVQPFLDESFLKERL